MKTLATTPKAIPKVCKCERHDEYRRFRIDVKAPGQDWRIYWDCSAPCAAVVLHFIRKQRQAGCEYRAVPDDGPFFGMTPAYYADFWRNRDGAGI